MDAPTPEDLGRDLANDLASFSRPLQWNEMDLDIWDDARDGWPAAIRRAIAAEAQRDAALAERDKLQVFKDWTHAYLDSHGVPHHPPGTHGAEGCRIGDRMDWLMARVAALEAALRAGMEPNALRCLFSPQADDPHGCCCGLPRAYHWKAAARDALAPAPETKGG